jgi:tetratricopeptide (TPR) repeat protein
MQKTPINTLTICLLLLFLIIYQGCTARVPHEADSLLDYVISSLRSSKNSLLGIELALDIANRYRQFGYEQKAKIIITKMDSIDNILSGRNQGNIHDGMNVLCELAEFYWENGEWEKSMKVANVISSQLPLHQIHPVDKNKIILKLMQLYQKGGRTEQAFSFLPALTDAHWFIVLQKAHLYISMGDYDTASDLLQSSANEARKMQSWSERASALTKIAKGYAVLGKQDLAQALLTEALTNPSANNIPEDYLYENMYAKFLVYMQVGKTYLSLGEKEGARITFQQAEQICRSIAYPVYKIQCLLDLAETFLPEHDINTIQELLQQSLQATGDFWIYADGVRNLNTARNLMLFQIAEKYIAINEISPALAIAKKLHDNTLVVAIKIKAAQKYAELSRTSEANNMLRAAYAQTLTIRNQRDKLRFLAEIAQLSEIFSLPL